MSNLILNEPVPNIGVPVLKPTKYTAPLPIKPRNNNQGWLDWLKSFVPSLFRGSEQGDQPKSDDQGWVDRLVRLVPDLFDKQQPNFKIALEKSSLNGANSYDPIYERTNT